MRSSIRTTLLLLLGISFVLNLIPLWWGLPSHSTWAPDELSPADVLKKGRWPPKYPPLHRDLLSVVYRPLAAWLEAETAPDAWLQRLGWLQGVGRLLSVLMATAIVYLTYRYGLLLFSHWVALVGAAIVALSPPFVYYAKTVNLEVPYLFWFTLSLISLIEAARSGRLRAYVLFGIAAALAVGTKDQAYGFYLASPLILVLGRLREENDLGIALVRRLLFDRRLWAAVLAGASTFALVHRLPLGWRGFALHLRTITGASVPYQVYEHSLAGQSAMLWQAVVNFGFVVGVPWLACILAAAVFGSREPGKRWLIAGVGALGAAYYLGFITVIGYHYARFFLPLMILAAPFAAWGLQRSMESLGWRRAATPVALLLLLIGLMRAISVDVAMLRDSRYQVEKILFRTDSRTVLGIGRKNMLPRGIVASSWGNLALEGCGFLDRDLDEIVVNATDLRNDRELALFGKLAGGDFGLDEVPLPLVKPGIRGVRLGSVDSNLMFVNPDVRVFKRSGRLCLDDESLPAFLVGLKGSRATRARSVLIDAMRGGRLPVRPMGGTSGVVVANLRYDGWTYGTQPAAVLVENQGETSIAGHFEIGCWADRKDLPVTAIIDDGRSRRRVRFRRAGRQIVSVGPVAPGENLLTLVWSNREWQGHEASPRPLGVSLSLARIVDVNDR